MALLRAQKANPYDDYCMTKSSVSNKKGQHEPPAKYNGDLTDPMVDIGIIPLDPFANDDDSVVLPDEDRYDTAGPRDPVPAEQRQKEEAMPKLNASKDSSVRKKQEPEAFDRAPVRSFQTMDMDASIAMTEVGGCVNLFDALFLCVGSEEKLQKAQSGDSAYSEFSSDDLEY